MALFGSMMNTWVRSLGSCTGEVAIGLMMFALMSVILGLEIRREVR